MATINGTGGNDTLTGSDPGGDTINGLGGDDIIEGGTGPDIVNGGDGNDNLYGGNGGADILHGDQHNDTLVVRDGDQGFGDDGDDTIYGLAVLNGGTNLLADGGNGNDNISVILNPNDFAYGSFNQVATISGGLGDDYISLSNATSGTLEGGDGADQILLVRNALSGTGLLSLLAGSGNDVVQVQGDATGLTTIELGDGDDRIDIRIDAGPVTITLGAGQDVINQVESFNQQFQNSSLTVTDFTVGNSGDRFILIPWLDTVLLNWDHSTNPFSTGHIRARQVGANTVIEIDRDGGGNNYLAYVTLNGVTATTLTAFNLGGYNPNGSATPGQVINGTTGDDLIVGSTGADTIDGLAGIDSIFAGPGNDIITGGSDADTIIDGEGGDDTITADEGDTVYGGFGNDVITGTGSVNLSGGDGNDQLTANDGSGSTLSGDLGFDVVLGSNSDDVIFVADSDSINGRGGIDVVTFDFASASTGIVLDLTNVWTGGIGILGTGSIRNIERVGYISGSAFNDTFTLGANAPSDPLSIVGAAGDDIITAAGGADSIDGGEGDDILHGLGGIDDLIGGAGNDQIFGGDDDDTLWGGDGSDIIQGGAGNDIIQGDLGSGVDGADQIDGGDGNDVIRPGGGLNTILGGNGDDDIALQGIGSSADGGSGNDFFTLVDSGTINGGTGTDTLSILLHSSVEATNINLSSFWSSGAISYSGGTIQSIEQILGYVQLGDLNDVFVVGSGGNIGFGILAGAGNDVLIGGDQGDNLVGASGNDILSGMSGDDVLDGGAGTNELIGGPGNDVFVVASGSDSIVELANEGRDRIETPLSVFTLPGNVEDLFRTGSTGDAFVGIGNSLDNEISAFGRGDTLIGYAGNDTLWGGSWFGSPMGSTLVGGTGDDVYALLHRLDTTLELAGEGIDTVRAYNAIQVLQANVENLVFMTNNNSLGIGNMLDNVITGVLSADELFGRAGNDRLIGGIGAANTMLGQEGDDTYVVAATGDSVIEFAGEGTDTVETALASFVLRDHVENLTYTGTGNFTGIGSSDANTLRGGIGADFLSGLDGDDSIIGGSGADTLLGGNGADLFRYEGGETGFDRILDFVSGTDKIALRSAFFTPTGTVDFVSGGSVVATSANSTILYDTNTGIVWYDDDGNGAGAAVAIAQLNPGQTFAAGDFLFY